MKRLLFTLVLISVTVIVIMCLLIPGLLFFSPVQSAPPPPPPPVTVWCCRNGQVSITSSAECSSSGGTSYSTQAEAMAKCEQAPPVAVWCCRNGQISITSEAECSSLGGTSYHTTQDKALAACLAASPGTNTGNTGYMYLPITPPTPTTYKFTVKIGPNLTSGKTSVFIDGKKQVDLAGGESRDFETDIGTSPVVSVSSTIDGQQGSRFVVKGDAEKKVSEGDTSAYFDYAPAVDIEFVTEPLGITALNGSGWHSVGDRVQTSAPAYVDGSSPGTRYTFSHWTFANGQKSQMKSLSLTVSDPAIITASYVTYYGLTVSSPYGPDETTWQKAGEEASWQVKNPQVSMGGLMGFLGGQMTAVKGSGSIMMDGPQKISVQYQPSYPWLAFIIIALVVIGGGVFAYFRLKGARAGAATAPATNAGTSATIAEATTQVKTETPAPAAKKKGKTSAVPKTESRPAARQTEEKSHEAPKFCTECGRPAGKGEKFCSGCGKKL